MSPRVPAKVLRQMLDHPLTEAGIAKFTSDWRRRPEFAEWLRASSTSARR
jgi:hypothetical protein